MYQCVFTSSNKVLEKCYKYPILWSILLLSKAAFYRQKSHLSTPIHRKSQYSHRHNIFKIITLKRNTVTEYNKTNITELLLLTSEVPLQCKGVDSFPLIVSPFGTSLRVLTISPRHDTQVSKHTSPKSLRVIVTHHQTAPLI